MVTIFILLQCLISFTMNGIIEIHGSYQGCKPGKTGRYFPVREKSGNFYKAGKAGEFYSKYCKNKEFSQLKNLADIRIFIDYLNVHK